MREVYLDRGTAHVSFSLWGVTLTLLRWWGFRAYHWNGIDFGGGCLVIRFGPLVVNWWPVPFRRRRHPAFPWYASHRHPRGNRPLPARPARADSLPESRRPAVRP